LFEDQTKNVDSSGRGDFEVASENLWRFAREPNLIELRAGDSLSWRDREIQSVLQEYGGFRVASIDGGHTPVHVVHDTMLATKVVRPGGILIVDDFYNPNFPGVTEGVYRLLWGSDIVFVPILVTRKKLFLGHVSYLPRYWENLTSATLQVTLGDFRTKVVEVGGHRCLSVWS
jgi:hypothetical protein